MRIFLFIILVCIFSKNSSFAQGGGSCSAAFLNQVVTGVNYTSQTTCGKSNNFLVNNGQDWMYCFCATADGCLRIDFDSIKSGDVFSAANAKFYIYDTCFFASPLLNKSVNIAAFSTVSNKSYVVNVTAGKCYYILVDVDDLGPGYADCISYGLELDFSTILTQTPGDNFCNSSLTANTILANTVYTNQTLCCVGNNYLPTAGNDWYYKYCANANGCITFNINNITIGDSVTTSNISLLVYDSCGAVAFIDTNYTVSPTNANHKIKFSVDSGTCYYFLLSSTNLLGEGGCLNYEINAMFDPITNLNIGANNIDTAIIKPQPISGNYYINHTTCCTGSPYAGGKESWSYYYYSPQEGCARIFLDSISFFSPLFTSLNVIVTDTNGVAIHFWNNNSISGTFSGIDTFDADISLEANKGYIITIESYNSNCATYDFEFEYNTTPPQLPGGNTLPIAIANALVADSAYLNQTTCCMHDNINLWGGEDWIYYWQAPKDGCIRVAIDSFINGDVDKPTAAILKAIDMNNSYEYFYVVPGTMNSYSEGPELFFNVHAGDQYKFYIDGIDTSITTSKCINYDFSLFYYDSTAAQTPGGNTIADATINSVVTDSIYLGQTTCCMYNDADTIGKGQDWIYSFCATQTGCLTLNFLNLQSGDPFKKTNVSYSFMDTSGTLLFSGTKEVIGPAIDDNFKVITTAGECYNIIIDAGEATNLNFNCVNFDFLLKYDSIFVQTPGGNDIATASINLLQYDSTYIEQTTCCKNDDNTINGQDWFYGFVAPQGGIYTIKIFDMSIASGGGTVNLVQSRLTLLDSNLNEIAFDTIGAFVMANTGDNEISISFCADSNEKFYFYVDDNLGPPDNCIEYSIKVFNYQNYYTPTYPFGSGISAAACSTPIQLNVQYDTICLCCLPDPYYFEFCAPTDGCVTYRAFNITKFLPEYNNVLTQNQILTSQIYGVGAGCSSTSFIAATTDSSYTTFHVLAGECYKIRLHANDNGCFSLSLMVNFVQDTIQTPGGLTCADAISTPVLPFVYHSNQTNCLSECFSASVHDGANLECFTGFDAEGSDYVYLLKPNQVGKATVFLDGIQNNQTFPVDIIIAVYKNCTGTNFTDNVGNITQTIPAGTTVGTASLDFWVQNSTDSFYLVIDVVSFGCLNYNFILLLDTLTACSNADFETGNTLGWALSTGYSSQGSGTGFCPSPLYSACPNIVTSSTRHTIVSGGTDYYGGFPKVFSGNYSLKLGDSIAGAQGEGMLMYFLVDNNHKIFSYNYAVVFQDPGHVANVQPFFRAKITDPAGNVIACTEYCVSANSSVPGFSLSPNSGGINVLYKPWTKVDVDLSAYMGMIVKIEFENGDCADGGHFGYSYIDCSCLPSVLNDSVYMCAAQCDTLFAPQGYTNYVWMPGAITGPINVVCPTVATTYTLNYQTFTGCNVQKIYVVNIRDSFTISNNNYCFNNGSAVVSTSVPPIGFTYVWNTVPPQYDDTVTNLVVGNSYIVSISDGQCYTISDTILFNPITPNITIDSINSALCFNTNTGYISVTGSNGISPYTYALDTLTASLDSVYSNLAGGVHTIILYDSVFCTDTLNFIINQPNALDISFSATNACITNQSSTVIATVTGGTSPYTYIWSADSTLNDSLIVLLPGTYTLTVVDANGCTFSSTILLQAGVNLQIQLVDSVSCVGLSNGSLVAVVLDTSSTYTYAWSTSPIQTNDTATNLAPGIYTVTVTDINNCTGTVTYQLLAAQNIVINDSVISPCIGQTNGAIFVNVLPTATYSYAWVGNASTTNSIQNIGTGIYTVTATNSLNCTQSKTITVFGLPIPNITYTPVNTTFCQGSIVQFVFSGADSFKIYKNNFSNFLFSNFVLIDTSFNLLVVGKNINGCSDTISIPIVANTILVNNLTQYICLGQSYNGYTTSGNYVDSFNSTTGCDSIVNLNLIVQVPVDTFISATICQGQSLFGYSVSGTYVDSLLSVGGCDSIRHLNLSVNNILYTYDTATVCYGDTLNGFYSSIIQIDTFVSSQTNCDSIHTFSLTVLPLDSDTVLQSICFGQTFMGHSSTGVYADTFSNTFGCDSIFVLILTVDSSINLVINDTICQGQSSYGYTNTGTYIDSFLSAFGCDSIRTLNLFVKNISSLVLNDTICQGQNVLGYTATGTYIDTFISSNGCDSIRTLNLLVKQISSLNISDTICQGQNIFGYTSSGTYTDTFISSNGCDSIRTINLLVINPNIDSITQTICAPSTYMGYSNSGTYTDTFLNSLGCDSIRVLMLTVNNPSSIILNTSICIGQTYNGYSSSGTYIDTFTNLQGCDSIRTINLYVQTTVDTFIFATICKGNNLYGYTTTGLYVDSLISSTGCDSIRHLNLLVFDSQLIDTIVSLCYGDTLKIGNNTYAQAGIYIAPFVNVSGCDSIIRITLSFESPILPSLQGDSVLCNGDSILLYCSGGPFMNYYWNNVLGTNRQWVYATNKYIVRVDNGTQCFGKDSMDVTAYNLPNVDIVFTPKDLCKSETVELFATGAIHYEWTNFNNEHLYTGNPYPFNIFSKSEIVVTGTDDNGCRDSDSIVLNYINCCGLVAVPNAFSPNGDGLNDEFEAVLTNPNLEIFNLQIFNRWGQKVFETNNPKYKWDGKYNFKDADLGVYNYMLRVKCYDTDEVKMYKGDLMLVR